MLQAMGAGIEGAGSSTIVVTGVDALRPVEHRVVGDRIAAGTFAFAAALTGGDVLVRGVDPEHLGIVVASLRTAGATVTAEPSALRVVGPQAFGYPDLTFQPLTLKG